MNTKQPKITRPQDAASQETTQSCYKIKKADNTDIKQCNFVVQTANKQHKRNKKSKNKSRKHQNKQPFNQHNSKSPELQGRQCFSQTESKTRNKTKTKQKHKKKT